MSRQCTCGGVLRQHELTGNREAWTCGQCKRYGVIVRAPQSGIQSQTLDEKDCSDIQVLDTMGGSSAGGVGQSRPPNEGLLSGQPERAARTESNSLGGFAFQDGVL